MKQIVRMACVAICLSGAGQIQAQGLKSLLGGLVKTVAGDVTTTETSITGTWTYSAPDCVFTSDNALMQAGSEIASQKVEEKLADIFDKAGMKGMAMVIGEDKTFAIRAKGKSVLTGTYTFDNEKKELHLSTKIGFKATAHVSAMGNKLGLTFEVDKLLELLKKISSTIGSQNTTIQSINKLAESYNGLRLGFELTK